MKQEANQSGAILVLAVLTIFTLLVTCSLIIDAGVAFGSQSKFKRIAGFAALAALETHLQQPTDTPEQERFVSAVETAKSIAGLLDNALLSNFATAEPDSYEFVIDPNSTEFKASGPHGVIKGGRWWFVEPTPEECAEIIPRPCICDTPNESCFEQASPAFPTVNAYTVQFTTPPEKSFRLILARLMGFDSLGYNVQATASLVPRQGVFVVDLSGSVQEETHLGRPVYRGGFHPPGWTPYPDNGVYAASAYELQGSGGFCPGGSPSANPCAYSLNELLHLEHVTVPPGYPDPDDPPAWNFHSTALCDVGSPGFDKWGTNYNQQFFSRGDADNPDNWGFEPWPGMPLPDQLGPTSGPWKHFKADDYECFNATFEDEGGLTQNRAYLVDSYWGEDTDGSFYRGPEPFTKILIALHSAMQAFEERSVAGDKFGAIGFNEPESFWESRILPLSTPDSEEFQEFKEMTRIDNIPTTPEGRDAYRERIQDRLEYMFFPEVGESTDISKALQNAREMLSAETGFGSYVESFVVLFSDGLSNCCVGEIGGISECPDTCKDDFAYIEQSLAELYTGELATYSELHITFHSLLFGALSGGHTILRPTENPNPEDGDYCMSDEEARKKANDPEYEYTDSDSHGGSNGCSPDNSGHINHLLPCYPPNKLWLGAAQTQGVFAPIRPCFKDAAGGCVNLAQTLDDLCKEKYESGDNIPITEASYDGDDLVDVSHLVDPPYRIFDPDYHRGRLMYDPRGRTTEEQVLQAMQQIMGENPFVLVQ